MGRPSPEFYLKEEEEREVLVKTEALLELEKLFKESMEKKPKNSF